ncbi:hypothetical protein FEM33_25860 [Dyadobacter flavalbus]|uniref:Uncharacterized protein n=1 Tax=Dyadobacter flavalbus TaxID=2579942 RepID=A0A5M8Q3L2_9BACT|nr:hypothetical protein [Dyadobacter flavalbus]KAA6430429.1 hypothetical protein FEM33_25860 [Dyadobacter flavalbus]
MLDPVIKAFIVYGPPQSGFLFIAIAFPKITLAPAGPPCYTFIQGCSSGAIKNSHESLCYKQAAPPELTLRISKNLFIVYDPPQSGFLFVAIALPKTTLAPAGPPDYTLIQECSFRATKKLAQISFAINS